MRDISRQNSDIEPGPCQIRIRKLPDNDTKQDVKNLFGKGKNFSVTECAISKGKGAKVGYTKFRSVENARHALASLPLTPKIGYTTVDVALETLSSGVRNKGGSTVGWVNDGNYGKLKVDFQL